MLEDSSTQPNEYRYISWVNGGRSFQINNRELFEKLLMPLYFKATKLRSFQRQLNLWGFERTQTAGGDTSSSFYSHPQFVRGQPENLRHILRVKIKGSIGKTDVNEGDVVGDNTGDHANTGEGEEGTDSEMEISSSINESSGITTRRITLSEDGDTKNKMKMPRRRASLIGPPSPSTLRKSLGYPTTTMKRANDMYTRRASDPTPYYHTQQTQYNDNMKNFNWSAFMADDSNMEPTTTDKLPAANADGDEFASLLKRSTHPLDVPSASITTNRSTDQGMMNFNFHPVSFDQVQANTSATLPLSNGTFPTRATCISEALATDVDVESILPISIKDFKPLPFESVTNGEESSRDLAGNGNEEKIKSEEVDDDDDDDEFGMFIDKSIHKVQTF